MNPFHKAEVEAAVDHLCNAQILLNRAGLEAEAQAVKVLRNKLEKFQVLEGNPIYLEFGSYDALYFVIRFCGKRGIEFYTMKGYGVDYHLFFKGQGAKIEVVKLLRNDLEGLDDQLSLSELEFLEKQS